jgi:D-alanyl-D-alanine carboxypeptidase
MFRYRIYAQGFTLVAIVAGSAYYRDDRDKRAKYDKVLKEQIAKEKQERWLTELEARDEEDREIRDRRKAMKEAKANAAKALPTPANARVEKEKKRNATPIESAPESTGADGQKITVLSGAQKTVLSKLGFGSKSDTQGGDDGKPSASSMLDPIEQRGILGMVERLNGWGRR